MRPEPRQTSAQRLRHSSSLPGLSGIQTTTQAQHSGNQPPFGSAIKKSRTQIAFEKKQFSNLTSVKLALDGKSGNNVEKLDGKESQITFLPYDLFQNKRILLLIQACDKEVNNSNLCVDNDNNKELHLFNENILTRLGSFF